ncbi:MAG: hypothetical protein K8R23_09040 [Chthoniobacter sp.]|nr:hypothetical protein [Chthoniobacter sp.]
MKICPIHILAATLLATAQPCIHAASQPPTAAQWEAALAAREQRTALLRDELKALDTRIEGRIGTIVGALQSIGDSKDSRTKVARMKEQSIEALKKNIGYFQTKRATLQEEMRRPTLRLTEEQKRKGIAIFDERIEKRVGEILTVQKSLPAHKDYERYRATGSDWNGTTYAVNEDHRQNQRVTAYTNSQRKEIEEGLRRSIARIEQQNRALKTANAPAEEIAKNDALIAERRRQLSVALSPAATPTREIGRKEALDLDKALQIAIGELRKDFTTLFARYSAYLQELSAVNQSRDALAAAKQKHS